MAYEVFSKEYENVMQEVNVYLKTNAVKIEQGNNKQKATLITGVNQIVDNSKVMDIAQAEYKLNAYDMFAQVENTPLSQITNDSALLASKLKEVQQQDIIYSIDNIVDFAGQYDFKTDNIYTVVDKFIKKTGKDPFNLVHKFPDGRQMRMDHYLRMVARSEQNIRTNQYIDAYAEKYNEPFYLVNERTLPTSREGSIKIAGRIISKDPNRLTFTKLDGSKETAIYEGNTDIGQAGGAFGVNSIRQAFILSDGFSDADPTELDRTKYTPNEILTEEKDRSAQPTEKEKQAIDKKVNVKEVNKGNDKLPKKQKLLENGKPDYGSKKFNDLSERLRVSPSSNAIAQEFGVPVEDVVAKSIQYRKDYPRRVVNIDTIRNLF